MYILNEKAKKELSIYNISKVAKTIGINAQTLSEMIRKDRTCMKLTAYCITKFLDSDKEIEDYFIRKEI